MSQEFLREGRFIRNAFLPDRRRTPISVLTSTTAHDRDVELVAIDTAHPDGHIYDELVADSEKGNQHIRLVRTTKPYNPDFLLSAHTLGYFFPEQDYSQRIVTPLDGDVATWQRFMEVNKVCAEEMVAFYSKRGMNDFSILVGASFNPYTDEDILRTQTIKSAHVHTFLISDDFLQQTAPFKTGKDFIDFYQQITKSREEMRMDYRRFFKTPLNGMFGKVTTRILEESFKGKHYQGISGPVHERFPERFPISRLRFTAQGLDFLATHEFADLLRTAAAGIEGMYRQELMPVFVKNYEDTLDASDPESVKLVYNKQQEALFEFDTRTDYLLSLGLSMGDITNMRNMVAKLSSRLSADKPSKFNLGPTYAFSVLYDAKTQKSDIYLSFTPFGGGTFDAIGFDKVWFPNEPKDVIAKQFSRPESREVEEMFFKRIQKNLSNQ